MSFYWRIHFSGGEKIGIGFLDTKHEIEAYMKSLELKHAVYLHTAFFYENLVMKKGMKRVDSSDEHSIHFSGGLPHDLRIPMIAVEDIGRIAGHILLNMPNFSRTTSNYQPNRRCSNSNCRRYHFCGRILANCIAKTWNEHKLFLYISRRVSSTRIPRSQTNCWNVPMVLGWWTFAICRKRSLFVPIYPINVWMDGSKRCPNDKKYDDSIVFATNTLFVWL